MWSNGSYGSLKKIDSDWIDCWSKQYLIETVHKIDIQNCYYTEPCTDDYLLHSSPYIFIWFWLWSNPSHRSLKKIDGINLITKNDRLKTKKNVCMFLTVFPGNAFDSKSLNDSHRDGFAHVDLWKRSTVIKSIPNDLLKRSTGLIQSFSRSNRSFDHKKRLIQ